MAHMDTGPSFAPRLCAPLDVSLTPRRFAPTVPVPDYTVDRWTYAPWSGHVDSDGWIWGRGAADCKNTLLATLGAVEKLVQEGFEPERNIILAFGFDEEIGGLRGAGVLAKTIEERYGKDSVQLIVDEGFTGVDEAYGVQIASLGGQSSLPCGCRTRERLIIFFTFSSRREGLGQRSD